jgi:hypothetical protein
MSSSTLTEFNQEGQRRFQKWTDVANVDDLATTKTESVFLNMLEHISVLTKAEQKELQTCLDRRNTAGHPNSASFEEVTVGAHIHELIAKVYSKY